MSRTPREKVLALVAAGQLRSEEGEQLLAALRPERSKLDVWLLDPFERLSPAQAWAIALVVCVASLSLASFGVRFDGALDVHLVPVDVPWTTAVVDQLVAWPLTAAVLWTASRLSGRRPRLLEMLALIGAARLPNLLAAIVSVAVIGDPAKFDPRSATALLLVGTAVPFVGWLFVALHSAFRAASGSEGKRLVASFVGGLVAAEIVSKVALRLAS